MIKENIKNNQEKLLSLGQFCQYILQNETASSEIKQLEEEKSRLEEEHKKLVRENVNLKSQDESFEYERIKNTLIEISLIDKIQTEAEEKIKLLYGQHKELSRECEMLTEQIVSATKKLESLNVENVKLNQELHEIKEIPLLGKINKSMIEINNDDMSLGIQNTSCTEKSYHNQKNHQYVKSSLM